MRGIDHFRIDSLNIDFRFLQMRREPVYDAFVIGAGKMNGVEAVTGKTVLASLGHFEENGQTFLAESSEGPLQFIRAVLRHGDQRDGGKLTAKQGHAAGLEIAAMARNHFGEPGNDTGAIFAKSGDQKLGSHVLTLSE